MNQELRNAIAEHFEETIIFDNPEYDDAIIGISADERTIYDYMKMVEILMVNEGMNEEEAHDFIQYNLSYMSGNDMPVILMWRVEDI